ncbi:hypothetical protein LCGC14_0560450 [marine sediment metagenome]|uniref:DUF4010 domain-containing protein n=1 Tax=marine sediment metagenome TaxID=412755 RepID=A0A0F9U8L6_9ZZZZ|nr:DUF4010 domain-containing protein [Methylophaga sp.]
MPAISDLFSVISLPPLLSHFLLVVALSFTIGLELHSYRRASNQDLGFGTTRTFTLIGMLGYVLYALDSQRLFYGAGFIALIVFLAVYYHSRSDERLYSLISPMLAIATFLLAPILDVFPAWFSILFVVTLLLILSEKLEIRNFSDRFNNAEMVTFSKYLIMTGVVLPLLPDQQVYAPYITVTYYQIWLSLLVVSSLSYLSYLAQSYVFKEKGVLFSGLLGGLYSSTATTIVLARRSRTSEPNHRYANAIILATAMMYLRLLLLTMFLGHSAEAEKLIYPFALLVISSVLITIYISQSHKNGVLEIKKMIIRHPLEFRTAIIFALLFVLFAAITKIVLMHYGHSGLTVMSFIVGLTDIDPFILSLMAGDFQVTSEQIVTAIIIATASNNLMKACYAMVLGRNRYAYMAGSWLIVSALVSFFYALVIL